MEIKKVWIVDANAVTALGENLEDTWGGLVAGATGIREITRFPSQGYYSHLAACVERLKASGERSLVHSLLEILLEGTGPVPSDAALVTATTKMGIDNLEKLRRKEATSAGDVLLSCLPETVSQRLGLKGTRTNVSASCASSTIAIAQGAGLIASGMTDAVLVCCADVVTEFTFSGFCALKVVSALPAHPFDRSRSGLTLGDGAAAVLMMSEERATREARPCIALVRGWGASNDAFHITSPAEDGEGLVAAMEQALSRAGLKQEDIAAVSAHGTGTIYNDLMELKALKRVFGGRDLPVYSVKGSIGHTTGAAGGIEVALATRALASRTAPPTTGFKDPEEGADGLVSARPAPFTGEYCMTSNSGFGGINVAIVLERGADI